MFYGTIDTIAARLGGSSPDIVVLSPEFNAGFAAVGLRRRRVLVIGLPMWWTLDGNERAAVVAHELAHGVLTLRVVPRSVAVSAVEASGLLRRRRGGP